MMKQYMILYFIRIIYLIFASIIVYYQFQTVRGIIFPLQYWLFWLYISLHFSHILNTVRRIPQYQLKCQNLIGIFIHQSLFVLDQGIYIIISTILYDWVKVLYSRNWDDDILSLLDKTSWTTLDPQNVSKFLDDFDWNFNIEVDDKWNIELINIYNIFVYDRIL